MSFTQPYLMQSQDQAWKNSKSEIQWVLTIFFTDAGIIQVVTQPFFIPLKKT